MALIKTLPLVLLMLLNGRDFEIRSGLNSAPEIYSGFKDRHLESFIAAEKTGIRAIFGILAQLTRTSGALPPKACRITCEKG
jgi:hypothetical protein